VVAEEGFSGDAPRQEDKDANDGNWAASRASDRRFALLCQFDGPLLRLVIHE